MKKQNSTVNTGTNSSASGFKPELPLALPGFLEKKKTLFFDTKIFKTNKHTAFQRHVVYK
jgi:hypothetical protein